MVTSKNKDLAQLLFVQLLNYEETQVRGGEVRAGKMLPKVVSSILLTLCVLQTVTAFKRTNIKFNKNTGGYKDIVVVINEELSAASCPQILDNVKVCGF